ncbi:hypothetical protein ACFXPS_17790 [Nocardia sp. NPDC059091]|uniref:hypothetical protein n=1 Tax=Nocardia sp. NPDC059091 TaxID=3346724 RepID=UPI0036B932F2
MIRRLPTAGALPAVGVNDFAIGKVTSMSLIIDLAIPRPVHQIDRILGPWLREHPEIRVVCRDRGGPYAEGARTGAASPSDGAAASSSERQPHRDDQANRIRPSQF